MRLLTFIISVMLPLLLVGQEKSITDFPQTALGKDANGENVMFHFIPVEGKLQKVLYNDINPSDKKPWLLFLDEKKGLFYNTRTLQQTAKFTLSDAYRISHVADSGYLAYTSNEYFFPPYGRPAFFRFDGTKVWSSNKYLLMASAGHNFVFCGDKKGGFWCSELTTGRPLWKTTIDNHIHSIGCGYYYDKSSSRIYYIADRLLCINLRNGRKMTAPFKVSVPDPKSLRFGPIIPKKEANYNLYREKIYSLAIDYSMFDRTLLTGMHSNWQKKGDSLFIADAENIYCYDSILRPIWRTALPAGMGSKSKIMMSGNRIYLLNLGLAFSRGKMCQYGVPFAAAYNLTDGKQIAVTVPKFEKKRKVLSGFYTDKGVIYWQTDKGFFYGNEGDSIVNKIKWKPKSKFKSDIDRYDYVILPRVRIVRDSLLDSVSTDSDKLVVNVYGKDVNVISHDGTCSVIPVDEAYYPTECENVYSTIWIPEKPCHYVVIDPCTKKILYNFLIEGLVVEDSDGNLIVTTQQGMGFHKRTIHRATD